MGHKAKSPYYPFNAYLRYMRLPTKQNRVTEENA